jgi:hypothetical protein
MQGAVHAKTTFALLQFLQFAAFVARRNDHSQQLFMLNGAQAPARGISQLPDNDKETLDEIEQTQAALRESIEEAKELAEKSERLLKKHRKKVEKRE